MKTWVENNLYTAPFPKGESFREILVEHNPALFVDFRAEEKCQWYKDKLEAYKDYSEEELKYALKADEVPAEGINAQVVAFPVKPGEIFTDVKRVSPKDKNRTTKKLCQRIVECMLDNKCVVIFCTEGNEYLALVCSHWFKVATGQRKWEDNYLQEARSKGDLTVARAKTQVEQMKEVIKYAKTIVKWQKYL